MLGTLRVKIHYMPDNHENFDKPVIIYDLHITFCAILKV